MTPRRRNGKFPAAPPPAAPPQLTAMASRTERLEAERADLFNRWRCALDATNGNVCHAAALMSPPITHDRANWLTRRLGLVDYAKGLRVASTGRGMGRPSRTPRGGKRGPPRRKFF